MSNDAKLAEVYRAGGEVEAQVIKSLLESYGIPCLLSSDAAASVHMIAVSRMGEVRVMVHSSLAEQARRLIESDKDV